MLLAGSQHKSPNVIRRLQNGHNSQVIQKVNYSRLESGYWKRNCTSINGRITKEMECKGRP